jgi:hypothetical protein
MIEQMDMIRWRQVERLNGRARTWWHYNRMTLVVLLSAIVTLTVFLQTERRMRWEAEGDASILATQSWPAACHAVERPTSIIIAGGSQEQVYDALMSASQQADNIRTAWYSAQKRRGGKVDKPAAKP